MGSRKKTITDLQIVDLLEAGVAEAEGRRQSLVRCHGDMNMYSSIYTAYKKQYRKKYSPKFLDTLGYNPYTVAQTKVLNKAAAKTYLLGKGLDVDVIQQLRGTYLDRYSTARHHLQQNYVFVNSSETLTYGGKTYRYLEVTNGGPTLHIKIAQWYIEALENRLNTLGYDGTYVYRPTGISTITKSGTADSSVLLVEMKVYNGDVLVDSKSADTAVDKNWALTSNTLANGTYTVKMYENSVEVSSNNETVDNMQAYSVDTLTPTVYDVGGVPSYTVSTTLTVAPNTVITEYVPVDYFLLDIAEYSYEVMYIQYTHVGNADEWYSYVENLDTIPSSLYAASTINMTAIVPVKENNVIFDPTEIRRKRLLRRLGIESKDMVESLGDANLDNAYVWTGLPISNTDQASIKVMFKTFDYLAAGSGNISVSISQLSMNYNFSTTKTTHSGKIMDVGTYSKTLTGTDAPESSDDSGYSSGEYSTLTLRYQGSETEWRQIVITDYVNTYTVSGHSFTEYLTSSKDTARLIIPLDVLNGLRYREYVVVFESSLSMICYSITVVKVKWYQTGLFKIVLLIVMVVIAIYTGYFDPEAFAASLSSMTAAQVGTAVLQAVAISVGIQMLLRTLGPKLGALAAIIAIIALAYTGNLGLSLNGMKGYLATASAILSTMDQAIQMQINELMLKGEAELKQIASKHEELQEQMDSLRSLDGDMTYMIDSFSDTAAYGQPNGVVEPEQYIAMMLGEVAYNWDNMYDVDGAYTQRKNAGIA